MSFLVVQDLTLHVVATFLWASFGCDSFPYFLWPEWPWLLSSAGQLFCRMSLNCDSSKFFFFFFWLDRSYGFWGRRLRDQVSFSSGHTKHTDPQWDLSPLMLTLITSWRQCLPGFSILKVLIPPTPTLLTLHPLEESQSWAHFEGVGVMLHLLEGWVST